VEKNAFEEAIEMSPTLVEEDIRAERVHRHDTSHRARSVARTIRPSFPVHMPHGFDPAMVADLPEPARRWLQHAIEPETLLFGAIEIEMSGEIRLGGWRPFTATQALVPDAGFVWAAHTRLGGLPVRGFDSYSLGEGRMSWRMLGLLSLMSGTGYDVTRSAADRLAAEAVLLPTSLVDATWRPGADGNSAVYLRHFGRRVARGRATITVAPDGALRSVSLLRWGAPRGGGYAEHLFEVTFGGEYLVDGVAVPDRWSAAWIDGGGTRLEFLRASIDAADCLLAGEPHDAGA
jgi:hypothetical protein